jgi:beta-galactosidase
LGCGTPSEAAVIFDWNVMWALGECKGFLQDKTGYEQTVIDHYSAFWRQGLSVDVIDSSRPLDGYKLIAAPMLYMLRPGVARKIRDFVKGGGTFVATYITGYADENDLVFQGGLPGGGLREVFGIWNEEIDSLYPEDKNALYCDIKMEGCASPVLVRDFCEIIHLNGAKQTAHYTRDFYAGTPAVTVNDYGKGRAWYIAARTKPDFLYTLYSAIVDEAGVKRAVKGSLPFGVTAQKRGDGKSSYVFLMNFTPQTQKAGGALLNPWECKVSTAG